MSSRKKIREEGGGWSQGFCFRLCLDKVSLEVKSECRPKLNDRVNQADI